MSNQRYIRLQEIQYDSFVLDAPAEIEKGALLLDTKTNSVLLQLRLNILNLKLSEISSITLKIRGLTDSGENVKKEEYSYYTYMDINLLDQKTFGEKTPIVLNYKVRKVEVEIDRIVFTNGNIWQKQSHEITPPKQQSISSLSDEILEQFNRELNHLNLSKLDNLKFFPKQLEDYWLCACGRINKKNSKQCCRCGINKSVVFQIFNEEYLRKSLKIHNENVSNQKRVNRKRILGFSLLSLAIIVIVSAIIFLVVIPTNKYNQATIYLEDEEYNKAIKIFESLGEFKDSKELNYKAKYLKASRSISKGYYHSAIVQLEEIKDFHDESSDLLNEAYYMRGKELIKQEKWSEAIEAFNNIDENLFPDVDSKLEFAIINLEKQQQYERAIIEAENGNYTKASTLLRDLEYKDSSDLAKKFWNKAYPWEVEARMTKDTYKVSEKFILKLSVHGGPPGEKLTIKFIWEDPNTNDPDDFLSVILDPISSTSNDSHEFVYGNPEYAYPGNHTIKVINNSTGEVLVEVTFRTVGD